MLFGAGLFISNADQLTNDGAHDFGRQQLTEVQVPNKLHICTHPVLPFLRMFLILIFRSLFRFCQKFFEFVLANIEHQAAESHRFATISIWEVWEDRLQAEDQISIGFTVVRFRHRFLEDQLDDGFQFCTAMNLNGRNLVHNGSHVLRAHFVQQALHLSLQALHFRLCRLTHFVCICRRSRQGWYWQGSGPGFSGGSLSLHRDPQLFGRRAGFRLLSHHEIRFLRH
mmetsp:Transcript_72804/g.115678  ORF Transcript_72804/g.115678 Transcript_72804/m.115678 type:complete len:226 (-) Transcript_72804:376-1053(-)